MMLMSLFSLSNIVEVLVLMVGVLINVAFITLMERKILGYSQLRLGPSKPSFWGLLQPMSDAIKLFSKELVMNTFSYKYVFFMSPLLALFIVLSVWGVSSNLIASFYYDFSILLLLMFLSFNVYPLMMSGWASQSKYSGIGSIRGVAQSISYEISLAFILMTMVGFMMTFSISNIFMNSISSMILIFPLIFYLWIVSALAESNRTPFDFSEGESELVSGFNTEYSGGGFAVIFMAEYGSIFFLASLSMILFFSFHNFVIGSVLTSLFVYSWVWARGTFPRYRYDMLMNLAWKSILPLTLGSLSIAALLLF